MYLHAANFSDSLTFSQAPRESRRLAHCYLMSDMTNDEIRHANLLMLIERVGGMRQLADRLGHSSTSTLSQMKNRSPDSKTGKPKGVGVALARKLEKAMGLDAGWMDIPHESVGSVLTGSGPKPIAQPVWPFADISPARWYAVDERTRTKIEGVIEERIREWEAANENGKGRERSA